MMILLNILLLIIGLWFLKKRLKQYDYAINHLSFFSVIWMLVIVGSQLAYGEHLKETTVLLFYFCLYAYIFGSSILTLPKSQIDIQRYYRFSTLKIIILILLVCCFIANFDLLNKVIFSFSSIEAWISLRKNNEFIEIDESNIFKAIFQRSYLIYIPLALYCVKNRKLPKYIFVLLLITGIMLSILRFTRAPFLQLLITLLVAYVYIYKINITTKTILITVSIILAVFSISQFLLLGDKASFDDVTEQINLYVFGGALVFQDILDGTYLDNTKYDVGVYSFDAINYILEKLKIIEHYPSYVREWSHTLTTNTYTYLDAFALDLGVIGAVLGSFFVGFFSDYSYYLIKKNNSNLFNIIFYGYICYFNVFVFANNEFIRFPVLLTIVILLAINFFTKKIVYE